MSGLAWPKRVPTAVATSAVPLVADASDAVEAEPSVAPSDAEDLEPVVDRARRDVAARLRLLDVADVVAFVGGIALPLTLPLTWLLVLSSSSSSL